MTVVLNVMLGRGRGGLERAAAHYHRALADRGYRVVTVGHPDGWARSQLPPEAAFAPAVALNDYDLGAQRALSRAVGALRPGAVLAHGNRAMRYVSRLAGVTRFGILHNLRFKSATGRLDACIAVTPELTAAARQRYPGMPIESVPNLVDIQSDAPRPARRDPLVIGAIGRLHVDKGFDHLLLALADPVLRRKDWRLVIAGEGPEQDNLLRLARRLDLTRRVELIGWVDDRNGFYQAVDLLCMPSRTESFGMVLVEAMTHGVPVIVSDNPGSREIVREGRDALVVGPNDTNALTAAIETLIDDAALASRLADNGRKHVSGAYALPAVAERLDRTLRRLIAAGVHALPEPDPAPPGLTPAHAPVARTAWLAPPVCRR